MSQTPSEQALAAELVRKTPLLAAPLLSALWGAPVRLKLENRQRTGSFKLRGALRRMLALSAEERARGVVAASAGNHGQGVALAASRLGVSATVFVPAHTPEVKRARIREFGAALHVHGDTYDQAEAGARARARATGAVFVSPFDDPAVIAGNGGELAAELHEQAPEVAMVVCPVGGGGLLGGLAQHLAPRGVRVLGVQPVANCAMHDSLAQGRALEVYDGQPTVAEGCEGAIAERTYALARDHVERIDLVSEEHIRAAVAFAHHVLGETLEPTGAVALAGLLSAAVQPPAAGETVCVLTGGNIAPELLAAILDDYPAHTWPT